MKLLKTLAAALIAAASLVVTPISAETAIPKAAAEKAAAAVSSMMGQPVAADAVIPTPIDSIYGVKSPFGLVFVTSDGSLVFQGQLLRVADKMNVTQVVTEEMQKVKFSSIPLENAIKVVHGKGTRKVITFEDPNCTYCKKLNTEVFEKIDDLTVYVLPIGILGANSTEKATNVLCQANGATAWMNMVGSKAIDSPECAPLAKPHAEKKLAANMELTKKYAVTGTPTIFFEDDSRANGYLPLAEFEARLNKARAKK